MRQLNFAEAMAEAGITEKELAEELGIKTEILEQALWRAMTRKDFRKRGRPDDMKSILKFCEKVSPEYAEAFAKMTGAEDVLAQLNHGQDR